MKSCCHFWGLAIVESNEDLNPRCYCGKTSDLLFLRKVACQLNSENSIHSVPINDTANIEPSPEERIGNNRNKLLAFAVTSSSTSKKELDQVWTEIYRYTTFA